MVRAVIALMLLLAADAVANPNSITIQRGVKGNIEDAYLWVEAPNNNSGSSSSLYTGLVGSTDKFTLLRFDLSSVDPGAIVASAQVVLTVAANGGRPIRVHLANVRWVENTVTWANFDGGFTAPVHATFTPGNTTATFELGPLAQAWINGLRNDGVFLEQDTLTSSSVFYSSNEVTLARRPMMILTLTPDAGTPGNGVPDAGSDGAGGGAGGAGGGGGAGPAWFQVGCGTTPGAALLGGLLLLLAVRSRRGGRSN